MTKNARTLQNLFRRKYLVGLVLLAVLVCSSLFIFFDQTQQQTGRAELVNIVSTQKALSQRIAFFSNKWVDADGSGEEETIMGELHAAILQMRNAHEKLSGAKPLPANMRRHLSSTQEIYFNDYAPFDSEVKSFLDSAEKLLRDRSLTPAEQKSLLSEINLLGAHTIMQTHDMITRIITYEAEQAIVRTNAIQLVLIALIVGLLAAESLFIFEPMGRQIEESVRKAETSERNAREEAERARQAHDAKANFLRMMSHELRTPLNAVIGLTKLLRTTSLNAEQENYARHIADAGKHMLSVANDILTINQHSAGKMKYAIAPADVAGEIANVRELLSAKAREQNLTLDFHCDPSVDGLVEIDVQRFRQVMFNLVGNALKFTDKGGVEISAQGTPSDGFINLEIRVADTGMGIPPEKQEKIFEEFEQAHALGQRSYGGAGLGLAISRKIIADLGGALTLERSSSEGSVFLIALRVKQAEAPQEKQAAPAKHKAPARSGTILVVDDNLPNRMIAGAYLQKAGFKVEFAENGKEAIDAWENNGSIDLIFMDIEMPVMDGVAATKALRDSQPEENARLPIIALTAHALPEDADQLFAAGFDEVLLKPTSERKIVDCAQKFLSLQQQAA